MHHAKTDDADVMRHRPALVSWNLTQRCNLRCPHCYLSAGRPAAHELETDACLALIDEMAGLGTEMLILTGGEPLLRRDVFELAQAAAARGIWVVMGTNGMLVTDRVARRMVDSGVRGVGISLDAVDPAQHDAFRGGPRAWEYAVRAMDVCRAHGLQVLVQTTVMAFNQDEIPRLLDFARDRGAWAFNLYFLVQTGRGQQLSDLSAVETEAVLEQLVAWQDGYRPMLVRAKCAPHFKRLAYERGRGGLESGGCMAGTQYCRITPEGDVTPCPYMTLVAGNVRERGFGHVWRTAPVLQALRDPARRRGRCGRCEYGALCGGCRCRAYAAFGDPLQEDPACTYEPTGRPLDAAALAWSDAARARLERIPIAFIREKVRTGLEAYARRHGAGVITTEMMSAALAGMDRPGTATARTDARQPKPEAHYGDE